MESRTESIKENSNLNKPNKKIEDQKKRTSMERSQILTDKRRQGAAEGGSEAAAKGEAKVRGRRRGARVLVEL